MDQANDAFQQAQMLLCVSQASVSTDTPTYGRPVTYLLQFELTFPEGPNSCIAVSMSVVNQSTNRMKAPSRIPPGINIRLEARTRIMSKKSIVSDAVTMANVKSL